MKAHQLELMGSAEAARRLGVRRATLYCYVSRGLVRAFQSPSSPRERLYAGADIKALLNKKARLRRPLVAVATALEYGFPVLESGITQIREGKPYYRGKDALHLAERASLEEAACILWNEKFSGPFPALRVHVPYKSLSGNAAQRALIALSMSDVSKDRGTSTLALQRTALQFIAAAALGEPASGDFIHDRIARAWKTDRSVSDVIRRVLVLCADNELSASTFAVRVVASTGAPLRRAITAGLAGGPRYAGEWNEIIATLRGARNRTFRTQFIKRLKSNVPIAGFEHPLYPEGDPRADALLQVMSLNWSVKELLKIVESEAGWKPRMSFGVAAFEYLFRVPAGAADVLYSTGRTAGWIAHACEQEASNAIIRPRANFVDEL